MGGDPEHLFEQDRRGGLGEVGQPISLNDIAPMRYAKGAGMPPKKNPARPYSRAHRGSLGAAKALVTLPASGCDLPVPDLPPGRDWSDDEHARWVELWGSPQATQWDETARGTVACLVIYEGAICSGSASAWQAQECRYAAESLGLTPRAMSSLGWRIGDSS